MPKTRSSQQLGLLQQGQASRRQPGEDRVRAGVWGRGGPPSPPSGTMQQPSRDMYAVLSGSPGGPERGRWQAEGSPCRVGTLVSDVQAWSVRSFSDPEVLPWGAARSARPHPFSTPSPQRCIFSSGSKTKPRPWGLGASTVASQPELWRPCLKRGDSVGTSLGAGRTQLSAA